MKKKRKAPSAKFQDRPGHWRDASGNYHPINKMGYEHLQNTIMFLERYYLPRYNERYNELIHEANSRNRSKCMCKSCETEKSPAWANLLAEKDATVYFVLRRNNAAYPFFKSQASGFTAIMDDATRFRNMASVLKAMTYLPTNGFDLPVSVLRVHIEQKIGTEVVHRDSSSVTGWVLQLDHNAPGTYLGKDKVCDLDNAYEYKSEQVALLALQQRVVRFEDVYPRARVLPIKRKNVGIQIITELTP